MMGFHGCRYLSMMLDHGHKAAAVGGGEAMGRRTVIALLLLPCLAFPLSAGIIFGKKPKPNPKERVPELIAIVKTDGDENKRASAADELRQYDPTMFPEIVPVL